MHKHSVYTLLIGGLLIMQASTAEIITLDKDIRGHLTTRCQSVSLDKNHTEILNTITLLKNTLQPLLPAAGLAAPQIGINQRIFLFSWDRSEEHQIVAINPSFTPVEQETELGWEGCFSIILGDGPYQLANVPRYKKIKVRYWNENGQYKEAVLEGFAARVFQHEYDHLEGIENIHHQEAEIKTFASRKDVEVFMQQVKAQDKTKYLAPVFIQDTTEIVSK